jgi:hypothetical protein
MFWGCSKTGRVRWAGNLKSIQEKRNAHRIVVGESERRRPLRGSVQT